MISEHGVESSTGNTMEWSEVVMVSAHKLDLITRTLTYLVFDHECGEYLEFTNDDPGFESMIEQLEHYLPLTSGWRSSLEAITPDDDILVLWKK